MATASASPGQAWTPAPKVKIRLSWRQGSKRSGAGLAAGSRLAAARRTSTASPSRISWPTTPPSRATKRRVFCTGGSWRRTSRRTAGSRSGSAATRSRASRCRPSATSVLPIRPALASWDWTSRPIRLATIAFPVTGTESAKKLQQGARRRHGRARSAQRVLAGARAATRSLVERGRPPVAHLWRNSRAGSPPCRPAGGSGSPRDLLNRLAAISPKWSRSGTACCCCRLQNDPRVARATVCSGAGHVAGAVRHLHEAPVDLAGRRSHERPGRPARPAAARGRDRSPARRSPPQRSPPPRDPARHRDRADLWATSPRGTGKEGDASPPRSDWTGKSSRAPSADSLPAGKLSHVEGAINLLPSTFLYG